MRSPKNSPLHLGLITAICAIAVTQPLRAEPLHDHDNGPLTGYFGVPDSTEGALLLGHGASRWDLMAMTANHSILDGRNGESITLDGETTRLELIYRRGITPRLEIGIELPFLLHESGGLDPFVDKWHDWFGLSGGFRDRRDYGQLEYLYMDAGGTQIDFGENTNGFGDARVFTGWQLRSGPSHAVALRAGIKLPTGDSDDLLGSGGTDISLGIAGDMADAFGIAGLSAYYRASAVFIGEPDLLADRYNDFVGHLAFGFGLRMTDKVELRVQSALRSSLFDSDAEPLGDTSVTVTAGANFRLSGAAMLSVGVSEDVKVRSAPDVSFQLALRYQPD